MQLSTITPFILTLDEEPNIGRVLERLRWADRVVVVDSQSTDRTVEIARSFPNVTVHERPFDSLAGQSNFGLGKIETPWALALDADYVVPPELVREIEQLPEEPRLTGYFAPFRYEVLGKLLRGSLYPPRQVLFRKDAARFEQDGHAHRVRVDGPAASLLTPIVHDDRKPLSRWLRNQVAYMEDEADKLARANPGDLEFPDRLRKTGILGPPAVAAYCLLGKGLLLDGPAGWHYTFQRVLAEVILSLRILERRSR